jgi:hypothetical protein
MSVELGSTLLHKVWCWIRENLFGFRTYEFGRRTSLRAVGQALDDSASPLQSCPESIVPHGRNSWCAPSFPRYCQTKVHYGPINDRKDGPQEP